MILIGASGSGKSMFASKHFRPTEIISSDHGRGLVSDDENDQSATPAAFRIVHAIARERLRFGRLAVIDATNVRPQSRRPLLAIARRRGVPAVALVFNLPEQLCVERNGARSHRSLPAAVIHRQYEEMRRSLPGLGNEGFQSVCVLESPADVDNVVITRQGPL